MGMITTTAPDYSWLIKQPPAGADIVYCYGGGCGGPVLSPNWTYYVDIYPPVVDQPYFPPDTPSTSVPIPGTVLLMLVGLVLMKMVKS